MSRVQRTLPPRYPLMVRYGCSCSFHRFRFLYLLYVLLRDACRIIKQRNRKETVHVCAVAFGACPRRRRVGPYSASFFWFLLPLHPTLAAVSESRPSSVLNPNPFVRSRHLDVSSGRTADCQELLSAGNLHVVMLSLVPRTCRVAVVVPFFFFLLCACASCSSSLILH